MGLFVKANITALTHGKSLCLRLTKAKTEMKREHWTKRWNWSSWTKVAVGASWTHGLIAQSVRASERDSAISIHFTTNVITYARLRLKQVWGLTKAKTEMKREYWTKRWNWSSCAKLALGASWTHGLIAQSVRASEQNSVVVGSNLTQANFI